MSGLAVFPIVVAATAPLLAGAVVLGVGLAALGAVRLTAAIARPVARVMVNQTRAALQRASSPGAPSREPAVPGSVTRATTPVADLRLMDEVIREVEFTSDDGACGRLSVAVPGDHRPLLGRDGQPADAYLVDDQERVAFSLQKQPDGRYAVAYVHGAATGGAASDSPWACDEVLAAVVNRYALRATGRRLQALGALDIEEALRADGRRTLTARVPVASTGGFIPFELSLSAAGEAAIADDHLLPDGSTGPCQSEPFDGVLDELGAPAGVKQPRDWTEDAPIASQVLPAAARPSQRAME